MYVQLLVCLRNLNVHGVIVIESPLKVRDIVIYTITILVATRAVIRATIVAGIIVAVVKHIAMTLHIVAAVIPHISHMVLLTILMMPVMKMSMKVMTMIGTDTAVTMIMQQV